MILRLLPLIFVIIMIFIPVLRIVSRTGLGFAWAFLVLVPILGYPALAVVLALSPWPRLLGAGPRVDIGSARALSLSPLIIIGLWGLLLVSLWASGRVVKRAGFSPWWALILLVPLVNVVSFWVFAFSRWPTLDRASSELVAGVQ
jgi:hypothetical protein